MCNVLTLQVWEIWDKPRKPWDLKAVKTEAYKDRLRHFISFDSWGTGIGEDLRLLCFSVLVWNSLSRRSGSSKISFFWLQSAPSVRLMECTPTFTNECSRIRWDDEARWPDPVIFANRRPPLLLQLPLLFRWKTTLPTVAGSRFSTIATGWNLSPGPGNEGDLKSRQKRRGKWERHDFAKRSCF